MIGGKIRIPDKSSTDYEQEAFIEDLYGSKYDLDQKWDMLPAVTQQAVGGKSSFWAFWTKTIDRSKAPDVRTRLQADGTINAVVKFQRQDGGIHCSSDTLRLEKVGISWKITDMRFGACSE
jgi:hypothetical protein